MPNADLLDLRAQIDGLDQALVELLGRRFRVTDEVGRLKASSGLVAVDPEREATQEARLRSLAMRHGVNPDVVARIFRTIVEEVVSNHELVAAGRESRSF
jgi:chorismate mutase